MHVKELPYVLAVHTAFPVHYIASINFMILRKGVMSHAKTAQL